ncbi:MAG: hypothetical protein KDA85_13640 [Planctomycetaceae bacterium]|nr:hypothetical protein [Planctomycetaceae bacterium]
MHRQNLRRILRLTICLSVAIVAWEFVFSPDLAFSQVQTRVGAARTVQYLSLTKHGGVDAFEAQARLALMELEAECSRTNEALMSAPEEQKAELAKKLKEMTRRLELVRRRLEERKGKPWTERVLILGRHQQRVESPGEFGERITISNMKTGMIVTIDPREKTVDVLSKQVTIHETTGEQTETEMTPQPTVDFFNSILTVPGNATRLSDLRRVDGQELISFQTVEIVGKDTWTRTFWVDAETHLPREIHTSYRSSDPRHGASDWIHSDIRFDEPLADDLFSTDPPAGYTVRESRVFGITRAED